MDFVYNVGSRVVVVVVADMELIKQPTVLKSRVFWSLLPVRREPDRNVSERMWLRTFALLPYQHASF